MVKVSRFAVIVLKIINKGFFVIIKNVITYSTFPAAKHVSNLEKSI